MNRNRLRTKDYRQRLTEQPSGLAPASVTSGPPVDMPHKFSGLRLEGEAPATPPVLPHTGHMGGLAPEPRKFVGFRMVGETPLTPPARRPKQEAQFAVALAEGIVRHSSHGNSGVDRRSSDTLEECHVAPAPSLVVDVSDSLLSTLDEGSTEDSWRDGWKGREKWAGAPPKGLRTDSVGTPDSAPRRGLSWGWLGPIHEHAGASR